MVTEALDAGPILLQKKFAVDLESDSEESVEAKVHRLEHQWYPEVINILARWQTVIRSN